MSGRKNILPAYSIFTDASMTGNLTSLVTNIQYLDNVGIQLVWEGTPEGTFGVQVSMNYATDYLGNVTSEGDWVTVDLGTTISAAGTADTAYIDLNQLSAPYIRTTFTNTFIENGSIVTTGDVAGSLNSTYFLIDGADGDDWYVWMDNGAGVDPAVPGRTGIPVVYADNDTDSAIAALIVTALATCTSIENVTQVGGGSGTTITFDQTEVGLGSLEDGADPTGFTFSYVETDGTLNGYIGAKQI